MKGTGIKKSIDFTIIVPHYNCTKRLKRLLESIGKHENMQIIVVDDNSDVKIQSLKDLEIEYSYVEFYKNPSLEKSAGTCRNIGIDHAKGKWIIFADADDYFTKDYYTIISKYVNYDADMIIFPNKEISEKTGQEIKLNTNLKYIDNYLKHSEISSELELRYKMATVWSRMILTTIIKKNNIRCDETIVANDVCFAMKVSYYCRKLVVIEHIIYCYTRSPKTLTTTINTERYDIRIQVFIDYYNFLKKNLSIREFKLLKLSASGMLFNATIDGLGIKYILNLYLTMKKNRIKVFDSRILNIPLVIKRIWLVSRDHVKRKQAY